MRKCLYAFTLVLLCATTSNAETVEADLNNDGIQDLKAFFNSDTLSRTELDRNGDGQADVWMLFASTNNVWDTRADYDEDYDGKIDEVFFIKDDLPVRSLVDSNHDNLFDEEVVYSGGVLSGKKQLNPPMTLQSLS